MTAARAGGGEMEDWNPDPLTFTLHTDADGQRSVTVDRWPREIEVDEIVVKNSDPDIMKRAGDTLTFKVANGRAVYQIVGASLTRMTMRAQLESCMLQTPDGAGGGER